MMQTRLCVVPDPIFPSGETSDLHAYFRPDNPELRIVLGSTGIASAPVFETDLPFEKLEELGLSTSKFAKTAP